jgi:hypothetical protein
MIRVVLLSAAVVLILTGIVSHCATTGGAVQASLKLRLSLHCQSGVDSGFWGTRITAHSLWVVFQSEDRQLGMCPYLGSESYDIEER